jgi:ketosteroid isomerase-like protein
MRYIPLGAFVLAAGVTLSSAPAAIAAPGASAVMATVHQFMDGLDKGDTKTALAACASPATIVDEFAPHEWQGADACADWAAAYDADSNRRGITDGYVTLGTPWHVDVSGNVAYVVVPATYTYEQHGKPMAEHGSIWTVVLKKTAAGWRIASWTWAKR